MRRLLAVATAVSAVALPAGAQLCVSGRVLETDTDKPVPGAVVTGIGLDQSTFGRETASDTAGRYQVCVDGKRALIQAHVGSAPAAYLPVSAGDQADLRVTRRDDSSRAVVTGRIVTAAGDPVPSATITVLGNNATVNASSDGRYRMPGLPAGSQVLIVRSVGLGAAVVPVDLAADTPRTTDVTMQRLPPMLEVVRVAADRLRLTAVYRDIGFSERKRIGVGHFMTQDQIERRDVVDTPELFRTVPGLRVIDDHHGVLRVFSARGPTTINNYGDCTLYVIDGAVVGNGQATNAYIPGTNEPVGGPDELMLPPPKDLIAIEVYQPSEPVPMAFPGEANRCLKILLWTRAQLAGG